jgi:putative transposase
MFFRTVREQFLVEVTDTSSEELTTTGVDHTAALLKVKRLFTAWVETKPPLSYLVRGRVCSTC